MTTYFSSPKQDGKAALADYLKRLGLPESGTWDDADKAITSASLRIDPGALGGIREDHFAADYRQFAHTS